MSNILQHLRQTALPLETHLKFCRAEFRYNISFKGDTSLLGFRSEFQFSIQVWFIEMQIRDWEHMLDETF